MNKFRFKVSTMLEQVEDDYIKFVGDNYGVNRDEFLKDSRINLILKVIMYLQYMQNYLNTNQIVSSFRPLSIIPYQRDIKTITFGYLLIRETESTIGT